MAVVSPAFGAVLKKRREEFNAKVAASRKSGDGVHGAAFLEFLREVVGPIVDRVHGVMQERTELAAAGLFDAALELFGLHLLGPGAKRGELREAWEKLLPAAARVLAADPVGVAGSVSNAVNSLCATGGAKPREWIERMAALAGTCSSAGEFLDCGMVVGWRCGLPQYRKSAMEVARRMGQGMAGRALGLPAGVTDADVVRVIEGVEREPWLKPEEVLAGGKREIRMMGKVGDFAGFGGGFAKLPRVVASGSEIFVTDGVGNWLICADVFNAVLVRVEAVPAVDAWSSAPAAQVTTGGIAIWGAKTVGETRELPGLAGVTSTAAAGAKGGETVAVTLRDSYRVYLVGRGMGGAA